MARSLEQELDELYGLPLDEFTAARNELSKRLKREGDERAEDVRRLAKPTVAVWALNQLARREPLAVRRLLAAGAALRKALASGGAAFAKAQREEREALQFLTDRARALLEGAGRAAGDATLERIAATLSVAAVDESARAHLKSGRLEAELEPTGFDALAGMKVSPRVAAAADDVAEKRRLTQERERQRRELRNRVRELERAAWAAEQAAGEAEADAREKRRAADAARAAADDAAAELDEA